MTNNERRRGGVTRKVKNGAAQGKEQARLIGNLTEGGAIQE